MQQRLPGGVFPASLTPLNKDLSVNFEKLNAHCLRMVEAGCQGVVLLGTTGEANSFSTLERKSILESVLETGIEPHRIVVGTGCCSLPETLELTDHATSKGVFNTLVLPPFYYGNISDEGLCDYFNLLLTRLDCAEVQVYLYHFPKMSGVPFSHEVIDKLLEAHGTMIAGIKDSSGDWENMATLCARFPEFQVFTGNEVFLSDILAKGGAGTISATLNASAALASEVYKQADQTDGPVLQQKLTAIRKSFEKYPMIPILKLVMAQTQNDEDWLNIRPPLTSLRFWNEDEVKEIVESL